MAPCGKKTTSGRMLGCVIFFPRLAHEVNRGVRGGVTWGLRRTLNPTLWGLGQCPENFGFGTYVRLGRPTYGIVHDFRTCFCTRWFSFHGFGRNGFQSMVLDASTCINMYCNIKRNIMKNQVGSLGFGIQGKISVHMCFMC